MLSVTSEDAAALNQDQPLVQSASAPAAHFTAAPDACSGDGECSGGGGEVESD